MVEGLKNNVEKNTKAWTHFFFSLLIILKICKLSLSQAA